MSKSLAVLCLLAVVGGSPSPVLAQKLDDKIVDRLSQACASEDWTEQQAQACTRLIDAGPQLASGDLSVAYMERCIFRANNGQAAQALPDCQEAVRLYPTHPYMLTSRGMVYFKLGEFDKAVADFTAALALSKFEFAFYGRSLARLKQNDVAGGNADLAAAKAIKPGVAEDFAGIYRVK